MQTELSKTEVCTTASLVAGFLAWLVKSTRHACCGSGWTLRFTIAEDHVRGVEDEGTVRNMFPQLLVMPLTSILPKAFHDTWTCLISPTWSDIRLPS